MSIAVGAIFLIAEAQEAQEAQEARERFFFRHNIYKIMNLCGLLDTIFLGFYRIVKWLGVGNLYSLHPNPVKTSQFCVLEITLFAYLTRPNAQKGAALGTDRLPPPLPAAFLSQLGRFHSALRPPSAQLINCSNAIEKSKNRRIENSGGATAAA